MPVSTALSNEHTALAKKITDMKKLLADASAEITSVNSVDIGLDDASAKIAIETMRQGLANIQYKVVRILPGGASKRRRSGSKKQHKKKGGKSRRQHK